MFLCFFMFFYYYFLLLLLLMILLLISVPATNPHIDWIYAIDYSTISLKWHGIEERYVRGTLLGYRVHIEQAHHHESQPYHREITVQPEQMEATITGLPAETEFRVWVAAFTSVGEGYPRHEEWIRTSKAE